MASAPPKIVCVIGMHRSGTSAVMRLLNLAGLDLGDDGSLELKGPDNPTGYWELRALREINDELLARWNATWSDPPNPDWIHASEIADLRARARETLSNLQSGTGPWGWKDPRTSVTLPFWKELLPRQEYVLCVRNPLSVAASLKARDGMPLEHALNLWSEYTGAALEYTQAEHRVIVNYESLMTNWKSTLRRIVENLGLADLEPPESIEEQVESFLQPQLSHYNYALEDVLDTPSLDFISKSLYCFLREEEGIATESEWAAAIRTAVAYRRREIVAGHALQHAEPDQTRRNHRVLSEELGDLRARARRDVSNLTRELVQAHNERDLSLLRQGSLEERVRSSEDALEELRANHSRLGTDYEKALEHGRTLEERVRSSEDALEELRANHSRLGTDYEKALEHGRTLEERVRSSEDALEELRANHSRLGTDYEKALEHGRTLSAEKEAQQARIIKYMASTSQLRNSRSVLQREHQLLVNQYGALQNEARRLHEGATSVLPLLSHLVWLSGRAVFRAIPMGARLRGYAKNSFYGAYGALRRNSPRVLEYREALRSEGRQNVTASADPLTRMETSPPNSFDVIVFPIIDWDFRRQRPQHLATQLANRGHRVLYLATTFASSLEHYEQKPRYVGPNIWVLQLPCPGTPLIYKDVPSLQQVESMYRAIERLRHDLHLGATVSLLNHPFWHPLAQKLSNNLVVYDCFDHHAGFSDTSPQILELESTLLKEADLVLCSAKKLLNRATEVAKKTLLVQNGADYEHFAVATRHAPPEKQRPIVGYFGAIADWFDGELVAEAALGFPDCQFVLVGSTFRAEISTLRMLPNVTFVGEVPYEELPTYLESFDVCLIPFKDLELTRATNPVKIYEYLSAGKPVVAVRLPELEPISDLVYLAQTREEFKKCLYQALEEAPDTRLEERQAYARENTWEKRAELLEEELEKLFPLVSVIVLTYGHLDMTKTCLSSLDQLTDYPNWELIVVDNASTDGTPGFLREYAHERENVTLVLNDENLGFSAGNNRGATAAAGDYLVFLNNDTYVTQGWIGDLLAHFRDSPQLGVLGPVTNNIGNEARIQIQYSDMQTMAQAARDYTESHRGQRIPLRSAAFFCVMIPRAVWEEIGELDEGYEVGFFEDDDYANRVRKARYDISCAEDVFVHHHLSASFSALGELEKQRLFEKNRAYYESKWGPWIRHEYRKPE